MNGGVGKDSLFARFGAAGPQAAPLVLAGLVALKLVLLFLLAWNVRFVMDEFVQLGWSKYLGNGAFDTMWPAKAVGFAVFYKLAHAIGWDAMSILLIGRMQTAILGCGTLAIIYGCARALGNDRVRSLAILLVLLSFSNFIERIFRTIAEPLALFFAALALLVILRGHADKARTVLIAGVISGLSFVATQKSVYFNIALGLGLLTDAMLSGRFMDGVRRGGWLVAGWTLTLLAYCLIFGGSDPIPVAKNLVLGPVEVATVGADPYGGLRHFVLQTLQRNFILYIFCFAGMALSLVRVRELDQRRRIALVFSFVITVLVFAHNQPWPYVFIMALPFLALWSLTFLEYTATRAFYRHLAYAALGIAVATSFVKNVLYLRIHNHDQLALVARAETLVAPDERYFDGVGMLPNRFEPTPLWLDKNHLVKTWREGKNSEAYRILGNSPTKIILWSYRMDAIYPVVAPVIANSYVKVAPNIRIAGRRLRQGAPTTFNVPYAGKYVLYGASGEPLRGVVQVDGNTSFTPINLARGSAIITLRAGPTEAWLLPVADYTDIFRAGKDNEQLFANVYD